MAFDGITVRALCLELSRAFTGARINKIYQPESDEITLTIKKLQGGSDKLVISANASLPLIYITGESKDNPVTAPNFCMLLRKHLGGGRILSVTQPGNERIINIEVEHLNEMGDLCRVVLIAELMGKHSNIILCDGSENIIDSIKRISANVSSVREILPGRQYFIPNTMDKCDPFALKLEDLMRIIGEKPLPLQKAVYTSFTGLSPLFASELLTRCGIDDARSARSLNEAELTHLCATLMRMLDEIREECFDYSIYYKDDAPKEFSVIELTSYSDHEKRTFDGPSELLSAWYASKDNWLRKRQKSAELRQLVTTALDKVCKKYDLQAAQLKDTEKRDTFRIRGELINTYGYSLEPGAKQLTCENYYDNGKLIDIPLDPMLSAGENAKKYFEKYNKLKRTSDALSEQIVKTEQEKQHLSSVLASLDTAESEADLSDIRRELAEYGFVKKKAPAGKVKPKKSKPLRFISSDGYEILVGKNNYQNEELTFKTAEPNDWWFHVKSAPGSHVIVKSRGEELPDRTFEEAGRLAAHYSSQHDSDKVEIDYLMKKGIKKVPGQAPGFVVYHNNYSLMAAPDISGIVRSE